MKTRLSRAELRGVVSAWLAVALSLAASVPAMAQSATDTTAAAGDTASDRSGVFGFLDPQVGGFANISTELYAAGGIEGRRPGSIWRANFGGQTTLLGGMGVNVDLVLSDEGVDFRQNVNQLGLNPTWSWGGLYAGDFTLDYSRHILQGSRVRGGGVLWDPGSWRLSAQAGRLERRESAGADDRIAYTRSAIALKAGVGEGRGTHLDLVLFRAWDALAEGGLVLPDTLVLDTIPADLRPSVESRPQDNWAVGMEGRLDLLDRRLRLEALASTSLLTRDREAPLATGAAGSGPGSGASDLADIRISTALDFAVETSARYELPFGHVDGSFEYIGPGYGSLGVPFLLSDRRNWDVGGSVRMLGGRVALQGRYLNQANNLTDQRRNTVDRNTIQSSVMVRPARALSVNIAAVWNTMVNDARSEVDRLDNDALALNTGVSWRHRIFGLQTTLGGEYGYQQTNSRDTWIGASRVWTHRISGSYRVRVSRTLSFTPKLSLVTTNGTGIEERRNTRLGFDGRGRFIGGKLGLNASVANTTSQGRDAFSVRSKATWPIGWGTELSFQVRHQRYTAFGRRPAFNESFFIFGLGRSF